MTHCILLTLLCTFNHTTTTLFLFNDVKIKAKTVIYLTGKEKVQRNVCKLKESRNDDERYSEAQSLHAFSFYLSANVTLKL